MSTRQALRAVAAEEAAEDFASGTEFGPNAIALTDDDFKEFLPDADPKTLVKRARSHMQRILDDLTARKAAAEKRIAPRPTSRNSAPVARRSMRLFRA